MDSAQTEIQTADDSLKENGSSEVADPEIVKEETDELIADSVTIGEDELRDEKETEEKEETSEEVEDADALTESKDNENEADEFLELSGMNFEADVIDETGMDDDEDGKEIHEGDGEHEDMKDEAMEEDEEEEEDDDSHANLNQDPNVMPQVNVAVLAQRKWQVKVYPLKPADFVNGQISRVFKHARESLLYLLSPGRNARGKGEMYISSVNQAVRCVHSLMRMEYIHPEINVEIIKKNDEGVIEEKAYLRFDSKLTQILTMRPFRRGPGGRKRDRLIGSVFVKNLPPGTTKDTLRVMFPFAQEINYNPDKFKDCTARLVLHYRTHVIPCLKAFAKVELGGNVLELHPLTKRKRTRTDDEKEGPDAKQRRKSEDTKKEGTPKKAEEAKTEFKQPSDEKKETVKSPVVKESKEKPATKSDASKDKREDKDKKDNKPSQNRRAPRKPPAKSGGQRKDQGGDKKPYRPKLVGGKERGGAPFAGSQGASANQPGKSPIRGNRGRPDRPPASSSHSYREDRNREFRPASRRFGNNNNRSSRPRGSAGGGGGSSRQSQASMGRSSYGIGSGLGVGATLTASDANLAINAEATKEMVLLQNQLSMAIKNQLAMLNQTQLAVEQAKRGVSSIGLGSELQTSLASRASPKGLGAGAGSSRRSVDQYRTASSVDDMDRYGERSRNNSKMSRRGNGGGNYDKRTGGGYRDEVEDWDREVASSHLHDPYASSSSQDYGYDRNLSSMGSSSRSYQQSAYSGYSGYY